MVMAYLILIFSAALLIFYFQATCQAILRREFDHKYCDAVVKASCLEYPVMRESVQVRGVDRDFKWFCAGLRCDYLTLTYLLRQGGQACPLDLRLLMAYFQLIYLWMFTKHVLRLGEERAMLRLTAILEFLANAAGQRLNYRLGNAVPVKISN